MKNIWKYELLFAALLAATSLKATSPTISFTPVHCTKVAPVALSSTITDTDGIDVTPGTKPRIYYKKISENNVLAASNDNLSNGWKYVEATNNSSPFTFDFDFSKLTSAITKNDTIQYFIVAQDQLGETGWEDVTFTADPTSVNLTAGAFPVSGVANVFRTTKTYSGTYTIDSTGVANDTNFLSITKAGGLFDALNNGIVSGNLNVVINHSLYAENGDIALNEWEEYNGCTPKATPSYKVKIKPSTSNTQVRGVSNNAIIKLNGADRVTIEGRHTNTSSNNDLTIANDQSANNTAVIHFIASNNKGCEKDTIRFCNIIGGAPQNSTSHNSFGIYANGINISDFNRAKGKGHNYNSFERNEFKRLRYGLVLIGNDTTLNKGNSAIFNIVGPTADGIDAIGKIGIAIAHQDSASIIGNNIRHIGGDALNIADTADRVGLYLGTIQNNLWNSAFEGDSSTAIITNTKVLGNQIGFVTNEGGLSAIGLAYLNSFDLSTTGNIISNNMIHTVRANGRGTAGDHAAAIAIIGGYGDIVAHNSINLIDDQDPVGVGDAENAAAGIRINSTSTTNPIIRDLTLQNNSIGFDIDVNNAFDNFSISIASSDFIWGTEGLDYNNYFTENSNTKTATAGIGSVSTYTSYADVSNLQGVFSPQQDLNSLNTDPLYISSVDLHISSTSPNIEIGNGLSIIEDDVDGDYRAADKYPTIGADEYGIAYVWYGRESEFTNGAPNWRNYIAPPTNGSDTIKIQVDTKGANWLLTDSFAAADLIVTESSVVNLDGFNFHIKNSIRLIGDATINSGEGTCANSFASEQTTGAVYLSGTGLHSMQMDSGSICNVVVTCDSVELISDINIANDFISKQSSSVVNINYHNIRVQGDLKLFGLLDYIKVSTPDSARIIINGTSEQMVEIRNSGAQPGVIANLEIDKDATGLNSVANLATNITIENYLNLKKGKLISDGSNQETGFRYKTITMLRPDSNIVMRTNGNTNDAFYQGHLKRKLDNKVARYLFPVGVLDQNGTHGAANTGYYTPTVVEVLDTTGSGLYLTATFYDNDPDSANIGFIGEIPGDHSSAIEDGTGNWVDVKGDYLWHIEYEGVNLPYNIQFSSPFMNASNQDELISTPTELRVVKRSVWNSGNWGFEGTHAIAGAHSLIPDFGQVNSARRTGLNTFSGFSGGGNSAAGQSLPVKLTELLARSIDNQFIRLNWTTASEINNAGFEVQRSTNGKDFAAVGFENGAGNSTELTQYIYDDKNVVAGVRYYYRLQQVDFDGKSELTKVVSAALKEKSDIKWMQLVPNPAEQASSVVVNTSTDETATLSISNIKGEIVLQKQVQLYGGINNIDLSLTDYAQGIYIVTLNTPAETFSRRLVVK